MLIEGRLTFYALDSCCSSRNVGRFCTEASVSHLPIAAILSADPEVKTVSFASYNSAGTNPISKAHLSILLIRKEGTNPRSSPTVDPDQKRNLNLITGVHQSIIVHGPESSHEKNELSFSKVEFLLFCWNQGTFINQSSLGKLWIYLALEHSCF